ncbi:MAG: ASKHA domain-containing protein [Terriglobia bacterium]
MATISCEGKSVFGRPGQSLFECADALTLSLPSTCGRKGTCHECIIEILDGQAALNSPTPAESFLKNPCRLACQAKIESASSVIDFAPWRKHSKILTARPEKTVPVDPQVLRRGDQVYYGDVPIDRYRGHLLGIAVDLGTTTVVCELVDLETGSSLCLSAFDNPQRFGGSDIMHRISYDGGPFHGELHKAIIHALNHEIREMCLRTGLNREEIYEIVVAGNSTMRDLFFDIDIQSIGQKPYKSVIELEFLEGKRSSTALLEKATRLGVQICPQGRLVGMPLIASHVGADTVADLLAVDMDSQQGVVMIVDIGTNTEVVVGHAGRMFVASCPAGPAFEGGAVKFGMPGREGAIESFSWESERLMYRTIGDTAPEGICGSGLIDLLAVLRSRGLMTPKGVFSDKRYVLEVAPEYGITFSREDASYLAQAKAANYCGQYIVLREFGLNPANLQKLYLAGGFANYIDVCHAMEIGFLAPVPPERVVKIGNASVLGAWEYLVSKPRRDSIQKLFQNITHVELETTPDFFELFVEGCQFKPMPQDIVSLAVPGRDS